MAGLDFHGLRLGGGLLLFFACGENLWALGGRVNDQICKVVGTVAGIFFNAPALLFLNDSNGLVGRFFVKAFIDLDHFAGVRVYPVHCNVQVHVLGVIVQTNNVLVVFKPALLDKYRSSFTGLLGRWSLVCFPAQHPMVNGVFGLHSLL